jgi:uncharacterized protein
MSIFLPVAGIYLSLIALTGIGASIGLLSGLFGVGGGFLLTPILMMVGVPATVAAASVPCQMVASSSSGVAAHFRLGNVDIKIGGLFLIGGLVGAGFGVEAIKVLHRLGDATLAITITYILVLGSLGSYMFFQSLRTLRRGAIVKESKKSPRGDGLLTRLPWQMDFPSSAVRHSILVPLVLAALAGVLASIMGVGGGFIMLPLMIYLLGMTTHVAIGTSLFQILFLSAGITYMQAATNHTVDLVLVLPLAVGSAVGAQLGVRLGRLLRGEQLIILLATLVLIITGEMVSRLIVRPSKLLSPAQVSRPQETMRPGPTGPRVNSLRLPPGETVWDVETGGTQAGGPSSPWNCHARSGWTSAAYDQTASVSAGGFRRSFEARQANAHQKALSMGLPRSGPERCHA